MKKFLSVDWDYFIACDRKTRESKFPQEQDESLDFDVQLSLWKDCYARYDIKDIGVISDFYTVRNILCGIKNKEAAISHKEIYDFISRHVFLEEEFEVYNIDYHHDMFYFGLPKVNCSNWVLALEDKYPNMKYYWIRRKDSPEYVSGVSENLREMKISDIKNIDYAFICRSDLWTPPHLDKFFEEISGIKRREVDERSR